MGGANIFHATIGVVAGGALAMAITYGIGKLPYVSGIQGNVKKSNQKKAGFTPMSL